MEVRRILALVLFLALPCFAQPETTPVAQIPFELIVGHIYFKGRVNDSPPFAVLLDSGALDFLIDRALLDRLGPGNSTPMPIPGFGADGPTAGARTTIEGFSVGGVSIGSLTSDVIPMDFFERLIGHETAAVLGADLFKRYVVEVDFAERIIRLYDPEGYEPPALGCTLPLSVGTYPTIHAQIVDSQQRAVDVVLLLDTGSNFSIVTRSFADSHPSLLIAGKTIDAPTRQMLSGTTAVRVGRVAAIRRGSCSVDNPIVAFSKDLQGIGADGAGSFAGTIGTNILEEFTTVFDYQHHLVNFRPSSRVDASILEYDMSGLHVLASGPGFEQLTVDQVMPGSPAALKGVRIGDVLEQVGNVSAPRLTVNDWEEQDRRPGALKLKILRNGKRIRIKLKLKPLI